MIDSQYMYPIALGVWVLDNCERRVGTYSKISCLGVDCQI